MRDRLVKLLDRLDELRAVRVRRSWGRTGRLLSWHQRDRDLWRARLSGPALPETVEADGPSRIRAIHRAAAAFGARVKAERSLHKSHPAKNPHKSANDTEGLSWH